jgi:predicted Zn-dependent protease
MFKLRQLALACLGFAFTWGAQAATFNPFNIDLNRAGSVVTNLNTAATGIPEKEEIALGRELAGRTLGAAPLVNDARLQGYVNRVGRAVAAQSGRPELPWRFGVMDTPSVNAFAAPGGVVLVTRGLYEILDNEAQLAAVLGHEVAHVMKRHHVEVMRKQAGTQALAGAGQTYLQASGRDRLGVADKVLGTGAEIFTKQLDQGAEYEADSVGLQLAMKAGYSAGGMVDVLQKLQARAGEPSTSLLFETHPHPRDRLTKVGDALAPQMSTLPAGSEPALEVAAKSLPRPVAANARAPAPAAGRAMTSEKPAAQQQQDTSASSLTSGNQSSSPLPAGVPDPTQLLRGLFGR